MLASEESRGPSAFVVSVAVALIIGLCAGSTLAAGGDPYVVLDGDTPASIAAHLKMTVEGLLAQTGWDFEPGEELYVEADGDSSGMLASLYVETDIVVQRGQTLAEIARLIDMPIEELADFNWVPRRQHLTEPGETLRGVANTYAEGLEPIAEMYGTNPTQLLREWNDIPIGDDLPAGRLLLVGWDDPGEGDILARPLVEKLADDVMQELGALNGVDNDGLARLVNPDVALELYVVKEGDSWEAIAQDLGTTPARLRELNDAEDGDPLPAPGGPLFIPKDVAQKFMGVGAQKLYRFTCPKESVARSAPHPEAPGGPLQAGNVYYAFHKPLGEWYAVAWTGKKWGWVKAADIEIDKTQLYYGPDMPVPEAPVPVPGMPVAPPTGKIQKAIYYAQTFAQKRTPYVFGGNGYRGIDCSGIVKFTYCKAGVWPSSAPRTAETQSHYGIPASGPLMAGDRLYFDTKRLGYGVMDHTGLYIGYGKFLHATPKYVRVQNLNGYLKVAKRRRDVA